MIFDLLSILAIPLPPHTHTVYIFHLKSSGAEVQYKCFDYEPLMRCSTERSDSLSLCTYDVKALSSGKQMSEI